MCITHKPDSPAATASIGTRCAERVDVVDHVRTRRERGGDFRRRVHPIVLAGCGIHDPLWWIDIVAHWEEQGRVLEAKLSTISRANIGPLNRALDEYADFRRLVAGHMATLADMNALTEEVHRVTDFAALVARLQSGRAAAALLKPVVQHPEPSPPVPPPVVQAPKPDVPTPWWAERVEHDGRGAFVSVDWLGVSHRLEWDPRSKLWWGTKDVGVDQNGLFGYADLGGVRQRFRWIPPGEFWMGSPVRTRGASLAKVRGIAFVLPKVSSWRTRRVARQGCRLPGGWSLPSQAYLLSSSRQRTGTFGNRACAGELLIGVSPILRIQMLTALGFPDTSPSGHWAVVFTHFDIVDNVFKAFATTFEQLYTDRETDEFEFNWRQPFPFAEYEEFRERMK